MPKKKPIAKRLNKLFDEIQHEEPNAGAKARPPKSAHAEKPASALEVRHTVKRPRAMETAKVATQTDNVLALAFQTSPSDWATIQVHGETGGRRWSDDDQALIQQVTDQLSLALENARLFQETQSRAEDLSVLNEMGNELSTKLEPKAIAEVIHKYTSRLMDTKNFYVAVYDENRDEKTYPLAFENGNPITLNPSKVEGGGFTDYIIRNKRTVFAPSDVLGHMKTLGIEFLPLSDDDTPSQSWLGVPMLVGNRVLGVVAVQSVDTPNLYDVQDQEILTTIASQAAIALENARLFQESQRRAQEMSALAEVGREISATLELKNVLEKMAEYAIILLNSVTSAVYLPDPEFKKLIPFAVMGDEAEEIKNDPLDIGEGILGNIFKAGAGEIINNVYQDKRAITIKGTTSNVPNEHLMAVPIKLQERVTGLMAIWRVGEGTEYNETEFDFLANLAQQAAIAIENARLFQESQRRAREMTALAEVGRDVSATLELNTVLERIAGYAKNLLNAESSAVYLPDTSKNEWIAIAALGNDAEEIKSDPVKTGRGILGNIVVAKEGRIVNDASRQGNAVTVAGTANKPFEHILGVPILTLDRATGLMAVWRTGEGLEFNQTELDFLNSLAQQAAIAIENARLFQEITSSQGQLSEALRIARIGYFELDWGANTITFTDELFDLLNTTAKKEGGYTFPLQQSLQKFVIPEDIPVATKAMQDAIASDEDRSEISSEVRYKTADGRVIWVSSTYKVERDSAGKPVKIAGSSQDINERKINELTQAAITQISESALTSKTLEELFKSVYDSIQNILPARNFYTAIYDRGANMISFPFHVDELDDDWVPRKLGRGLTAHVIRTGKPLRITPEIFSDMEASGEIISDGVHSIDWLGVPLRLKQVITGVMAVQTYDTSVRITERHTDIFLNIATQVASAMERFLAEREIQKFKLGIDRSDNAVFITDPDGTIQYANPAFEKVYGYKPEEAIGNTPRIIKSGITTQEQYKYFWNTLLSGGTISGELTNKRKDGRLIPISGTNSPILDETGKIVGFLAVHQDITERKQAEELIKRRNDYLAASAEIGRLVTSTLDLNTIFTRTVSLIGDRLGFYFAAIYQIDEEGFHAILREGTGGAGESMKIQKHRVAVGSQTMIGKVSETGVTALSNDITTEPLYQPNPLLLDTLSEMVIPLKVGGRILGVIDIQSKQAQAFTEDSLSVLQSLADQVAVAINNATLYDESQELIKTLKEVDQLKSQFLANMSHELRTPLNSIIGFSRVILKGIDGPITEMQNQDLTAIYNSGQHLLGLINDILDLARIEAGKMELNFEEVKLSEMVHSVFSTAKGLVKEKPIKLIEQIPTDMPAVRGDTMRVRQVLLNLISNASKFTDEGSITVETKVQTAPTGKLEALINVIDTGPGISPEGQEKLFKAFSQVDGSATRKSGGSGLGLSICANLVQLHGGRIGVMSEEGRGSTFWFTIPLFHQPFEQIPAGKKVVLAIDDDPQVVSLYERYLNPQGYHVIPLTEPAKARERVKELKPFAVTLDIMMPNIDGWTVLTDLKSDPDTRSTPIIICSIVEQTDKGFNLGAADYLVKPILEEDIVHALDRLNKDGEIREVLVIDDDPNDLRLIEKVLRENSQYKTVFAEGGRAGWEAINTKPPDAIILDIFMPEMDGFTILEKLRENPALRNIPVLVVSGGGLTNEQHQQLADYGQRMIAKGSLAENDLIASIEHALKRIGD